MNPLYDAHGVRIFRESGLRKEGGGEWKALLQRYSLINERMRRWLWWLVILGLIASLPLVYKRVQTERSTKNVDIVFDYRDLLEASTFRPDPDAYIQEQLKRLKEAGVGAMAVYESTLEELKNSRRIQLFRPTEYAALVGNPASADENSTYLLFTSDEARDKLRGVIEKTYRDRLGIAVDSWSHGNRQGLIIRLPYEEANTKPMEPDPMTLDMLQKEQFRIVARLSNRMQPYAEAELDALLKRLSQRGIKRIIFDGTAVTGYDDPPKPSHVPKTAELMRKYGIGAGIIERLKAPQKGFTISFAERLNYDIVRVFPLFETEANLAPEQIADKLVLAVKDRNIRLLFLNTKPAKDMEKGYVNDYLDNICKSLTGPEGAVARIQKAGYKIGEAHAFVEYGKTLRPLKLLLLSGGTALIALTIGCFFPALVAASFAVGLVGIAGLHTLSPSVALQAMAFGVGVCAPTLAVLLAIRRLGGTDSGSGGDRSKPWGTMPADGIRANPGLARAVDARTKPGLVRAIAVFIRTVLFTLIGVLYVVGLLSGITYYLVLEQYRGVALLHLAPIALVALYVLFFAGAAGWKDVLIRVRSVLFAKITVLWVVLAAVFGAALFYYLTRTGNEGQASEYEKMFRALLENTLGVRPRSKEFLFAHPVFILAAYLFVRYRKAIYLFAAGVMGQLSIVDTFAHLHTPLYISAIRVAYGILFGILISLVYVAAWELFARGWRKWAPKLNE